MTSDTVLSADVHFLKLLLLVMPGLTLVNAIVLDTFADFCVMYSFLLNLTIAPCDFPMEVPIVSFFLTFFFLTLTLVPCDRSIEVPIVMDFLAFAFSAVLMSSVFLPFHAEFDLDYAVILNIMESNLSVNYADMFVAASGATPRPCQWKRPPGPRFAQPHRRSTAVEVLRPLLRRCSTCVSR